MAANLFDYIDYRKFIRDQIKAMPRQGRGVLTKISEHLQINTTLLSQIMSGSRDFNLEQTIGLAQFLGLNKLELEYFMTLVQLERAANQPLKKHFQEKLDEQRTASKKLASRLRPERSLSESEKAVFYSSWLYSAIHLFCSLNEKGVMLEDVVQRFDISRARAAEILQFLTGTNLCLEHKNRFTMGTQSTFVAQGSPHLVRHHLNWRLKAMEKADALPDSDLMYTAQISLSKSDFDRIREHIVQLIKKINEVAKPSPPEELINLNIDLFRIE